MLKIEISKLDKPKPSDNLVSPNIKFRGQSLNDKQIRILELIGEGHSNAEISRILEVSDRSVDGYIYDIRNLISKELGYRLGERQLVLFAKEMLDGYVTFVQLKAQHDRLDKPKSKHMIRLGHANLIEDWECSPEDDDEFSDEDLDAIFPKDGSYRNHSEELEIADFKIEKMVYPESENKYYMVY
jgi:DNA-binding CsgD family transcriptional regulator